MGKYSLADDHTDPAAERALIGALAQNPDLYWELDPPAPIFTGDRAEAYGALRDAIEDDSAPPDALQEWDPAPDPAGTLGHLEDNFQRRRIAELLEDGAQANANPEASAPDIVSALVEGAAKIENELSRDAAGTLSYPSDLVPGVMEDVREARERYQAEGDHVTGVRTGLSRLDDILGGLQPGLTILSGGPGTGKTTLALQIAADAAQAGTPALYVTFENSPKQLTLKGISAAGRLNSRDVRRGQAPLDDVWPAAERWKERARRLAIIEGRADLSRGQIRGKARRLMNRFEATRCLVVVDYLQLYAKAAEDLRGLSSLREKVETMGNELRDVAMRLRSPVLALSSQSRGANYDSDGGGRAALDTLKESGDLEYSADAVAFLTGAQDRMATDPARALDLTVKKNRHGEAGKRVELVFRPDYGTMRPASDRTPEGAAAANGSPF